MSTTTKHELALEHSDVQLVEINLSKVAFEIKSDKVSTPEDIDAIRDACKISGRTVSIDEAKREITVELAVKVGFDLDEPLYTFEYVIIGRFAYRGNEYDSARLELWARNNAIYTLIPFLREGMYVTTLTSKHAPFLLPMFTIPLTT
ncbi:MAG: hypothetical protein JSS89_12005 [Bacteroidetes bacterium]|nr:hypothetical protein [Bacteroidota bacterium]